MGGVREGIKGKEGRGKRKKGIEGEIGNEEGRWEGGRRGEWVGRKKKGMERWGKGRGRGKREKRGVGKREEGMEGEMWREGG